MKDVKDWITVKRMYERGMPIRQIARELKISRNSNLRSGASPHPSVTPSRSSEFPYAMLRA